MSTEQRYEYAVREVRFGFKFTASAKALFLESELNDAAAEGWRFVDAINAGPLGKVDPLLVVMERQYDR